MNESDTLTPLTSDTQSALNGSEVQERELSPLEAQIKRLGEEAAVLEDLDTGSLSDEDRAVYDQWVAERQAKYNDLAERIRSRNQQAVNELNGDVHAAPTR